MAAVSLNVNSPIEVLIVDDTKTNLSVATKIVTRALDALGHPADITTLNAGYQVVDISNCDIVILDKTMPQESGDQTARRIRDPNGLNNKKIPLVFYSSEKLEELLPLVTPEGKSPSAATPFNAALHKPATVKEWSTCLQKFFPNSTPH